MRHRALGAALACLATASCTTAAAPSPDVLLAADAAFDEAVSQAGSAAWLEWFAEDGSMVSQGVGELRGHDRIRDAIQFLDQPGTSLRWTPRRADIAASGDLGWTTGTYVSEAVGPDGEVTRGQGVYVSIWRLQPDGSWKVVMDLGNPTTPADAGG